MADLASPAVELLAPRPGERILDLGCGDGALTERLVALGCEVLARTEIVAPEDLPPHVAAGLLLGPSPTLPRQTTLAEAERIHILQTLERFGRNHSGAAEALGIGRTTLWRKLKEYGIER